MAIRRILFPAVLATVVLVSSLGITAFAITSSAYDHYQKAIELEKTNDLRGAEREYRLAAALDPYDSLTYLRLAALMERNGKRDEALQLYQRALELNPKDATIHLSMAQLWEAKNQPAKALQHYKQFLNVNPQYIYAYLPMARVEKELRHFPEAIRAYQTFLNNYPKHIDAQRELASLLLVEKQFQQAADLYKSLKTSQIDKFKDDLAYGIALNNVDKSEEALAVLQSIKTPSALLYEQMGIAYEKLNNLSEAQRCYQKALELAPKEKYGLYLKVADIAMTLNQPDTAASALKAYLAHDPKNTKIAKSLADLYLQQKDYDLAASTYQIALNSVTSDNKEIQKTLLQNLGYAYQMQGQLDKAIDIYEKALLLEHNQQIMINLALAHHQQGNYLKALELYRKLLVADPQSLTLRKDMGQVLLALGDQSFGKQDYNGAINYYQDALLLGDTDEAPALLGLANTQYALKNYQMAYTLYQRVLDKDPDNLLARLNKAQLDLNQKNYIQALDNLRSIIAKKPDFFDAYRLLAQTHEGLGDYGQAITYYQKALELNPKNTQLLIGYGNAWRQVGNLDRAQQAYEMARTESPQNAMLRYNLGSVYNQKNNLDASLQEYREAIKLNPTFVDPYYGMGVTLEKQKKLEEALATYQQFLEKAPVTSSYRPFAKERVEVLRKTLNKQPVPAPKTSSTTQKP